MSAQRDILSHFETKDRIHPSNDIVDLIHRKAGLLPQVELTYEESIRTLWITLKPEPKPVFTLQTVSSVRKVQGAVMQICAASDAPILFVAFRGRGPIYSLGGDLDFYLECLVANDRTALIEYARIAAEVIRLNRTGLDGTVISLATVHGRALGGGIDPARACNVMIAEESATFAYPEINYNHFPISAVPILSRHTGYIEAEKILMSGRDYSAAEFLEKGALDAVVPNGTGEDWIRDYAARTAPTHRARVALLATFNRQIGNLGEDLREAAQVWVDHMMKLKPLEISQLQRITHAQERMLSRLMRRRDVGV